MYKRIIYSQMCKNNYPQFMWKHDKNHYISTKTNMLITFFVFSTVFIEKNVNLL